MKKTFLALTALFSISAFAYEVECTVEGKYLIPLRSASASSYDKHFTTVLKGDGEALINITNNIVLRVRASEYSAGEVDISLAAGRTDFGWNPYATALGINYVQFNLNKNSLSQSLYDSDAKVLEGSQKKRDEAFQKLLNEKEAVKKEFVEKHGELASYTCRVKR